MKVLYVARHDSGGNDDEGAISHALTELGHQVHIVHESGSGYPIISNCQFLLFHKWHDPKAMSKLPMPKVCWYFDLVDFPDPTIEARCSARVHWMLDTLPLVDLMFCTDGDWVAKVSRGSGSASVTDELPGKGKMIWLPQGADGRLAGKGKPSGSGPKVLFTGIRDRGGQKRESFVDEMKARYKEDFVHVAHGVHRAALRELIARSDIVVAPDGPVTDKYWSNRVYLTLGFGGFLLHPACGELAKQYDHGEDVIFYHDRGQLHELIAGWRDRPDERRHVAERGLATTLSKHLQAQMRSFITTVKERLHL